MHRALVSSHGWGDDGLTAADSEDLENTANHISETERRSMMAERDTTDRYLAAFLSERVGNEFAGRISGIAKYGAFVRLDDTGADGLIPVRSLGSEFFHFDRESGTLMGVDSGFTLSLGQKVTVKLTETAPISGSVALELVSVEGEEVPRSGRGGGHRKGRPGKRQMNRAKKKSAKVQRKVKRTRR